MLKSFVVQISGGAGFNSKESRDSRLASHETTMKHSRVASKELSQKRKSIKEPSQRRKSIKEASQKRKSFSKLAASAASPHFLITVDPAPPVDVEPACDQVPEPSLDVGALYVTSELIQEH